MNKAPVVANVTVGDLYPKTKKAALQRKAWYLDTKSIRQKKQFKWTLSERALLYDLRVKQGMSIPEIQKYFRKKNKIPIYLGVDDKNDKFSRTRLHNQIRLARGAFKGLCYKCRKPLTQRDIKRLNKKEKEDPSLGLCLSCTQESAEYKRERREEALKKGICPICMKRKVAKGHTMCRKCLSASHRLRYIQGLCGRCGEKPLSEKSICLCDDCLTDNRKSSKKYRRKNKLKLKKQGQVK